MEAVKRPTLKEFLALPCGEVLGNPSFSVYLEPLIREWAIGMKPTEGQLPGVSAAAFASWLDHMWEDWTGEPERTVKDVLEGAVADWCGGRTF